MWATNPSTTSNRVSMHQVQMVTRLGTSRAALSFQAVITVVEEGLKPGTSRAVALYQVGTKGLVVIVDLKLDTSRVVALYQVEVKGLVVIVDLKLGTSRAAALYQVVDVNDFSMRMATLLGVLQSTTLIQHLSLLLLRHAYVVCLA
jgi:hypothetical protein